MLQPSFEQLELIINSSDRFERLMTRADLEKVPNYRWCLAPDCVSGQVHDIATDGPCFTCVSCEHKSCATHNVKWHEGQTCAQFNRHREGIKHQTALVVTSIRMALTAKRCPKCDASITKRGGCDHMTCEFSLFSIEQISISRRI